MKKLLISENLVPIVKVGTSILSRKKIELLTASSGEELLRIHSREPVNLIIADLNLNGMNGDEVCRMIRSDNSLKKVSIILACDNDASSVARCSKCGANAFITKPLESENVFSNIRKYLYVAERKNVRMIFQYILKGEEANIPQYGNTENISMSGIYFESQRLLKEGDEMECSFTIGEKTISVAGHIIRVVKQGPDKENFGFGLQFSILPSEHMRVLEEFINNR